MVFLTKLQAQYEGLAPCWREILPCIALAFLVLAAYGDVYANQFVFDDDKLIVNNLYLRDWSNFFRIFMGSSEGGAASISNFYRPMQTILYLVIYQVVGPVPFGFHLLNTLLHVANTCLVYGLGRKLGFRPVGVFLAAMLWGLHPIQTESVAYMSATADPLLGLFCLSGVYVLLPNFTPQRIFFSCILFILGLMSKEASIVLPGLAAATLYLVSPERRRFKTYLRLWPLWFIAGIYLCLHLTIFNFQAYDGSFDLNPIAQEYKTHMWVRLATCFATVPVYLGMLIWPVGLHLERNFSIYTDPMFPEVFIGGGILLAGLAYILWTRGKRGLALGWGFLWFGIAWSPDTGIAMAVNALLLEHWMYLPTAGLFLGICETLAAWFERKQWKRVQEVAAGVALCLGVLFAVMTYRQNPVWHDAFTLYPHILSFGEPSPRSHNNLGKAYMDVGMYDKALEQYRDILQLGAVLPEVHQNIASTLTRFPDWEKHPEEVISELKAALEINPNFVPACDGLAYVYDLIGDKGQSKFYADRAAKLRKQFMP